MNESLSYESQKAALREKMQKKIMKEKALKDLEVTKSQTSSDNHSESSTDDRIDELEIVRKSVCVTLNIVDSCVSN